MNSGIPFIKIADRVEVNRLAANGSGDLDWSLRSRPMA